MITYEAVILWSGSRVKILESKFEAPLKLEIYIFG